MKLQFGLLWIEDRYSDQEADEIRAGASTAGFELEITNSKDGADIETLAERQQKFHSFDLILLDLNLASGVKGDQLAPDIRRLFRSTPILFYTGSESEEKLRERMAKEKIEGVFCAHRTDGIGFTGRAAELIQDYAHTLNRLSGMRGLAMEVVAEIDVLCREVITNLAVDDLETFAASFLDKAVREQSENNLEKFPDLPGLSEKMDHSATDSMKSFKLFRTLLKKHIGTLPDGEEKDKLSAHRNETRDYVKNVIDIRNTLGHALEKQNDQGWLILDRYGNEITVSSFPNFREDFIQHLRAFRQIRDILIPE